jgi:polysaccharide pyruvyl transferase WcaK-like protein
MKIALLTPYTGDNLGDAAIQEAVIANIRARFPGASLCLVTMLPERTAQLHAVPSFPVSRFARWQDFGVSPIAATEPRVDPPSTPTKRAPIRRLKAAIGSCPWLHSAVKPVYDKLWPVYDELRHIRRAYRFLNSVDLLIVSGGGQLDEFWGGAWGHPYALFKWGLLAKMAGSRFVILSVGTCRLESKLSGFFIRQTLRLASYRSYRDQASKDSLEHMAFTRDDEVYPDLAFSYSKREEFENLDNEPNCKVIGVSPICYLSPYGWPEQDVAVYERYFEALLALVRISTKRGYSVVLFSTAGSDDEKIAGDIVDTLTKENDLDVTSRVSHPRTRTLAELFCQLRRVNYVVASRLHGVLLSHRLCLPVLAISYDRKVDTYMADVGLSHYCMDIHDVTTDSLVEVLNALMEKSGPIRSVLSDVNHRYALDLKRQYDVVLRQANTSSPPRPRGR